MFLFYIFMGVIRNALMLGVRYTRCTRYTSGLADQKIDAIYLRLLSSSSSSSLSVYKGRFHPRCVCVCVHIYLRSNCLRATGKRIICAAQMPACNLYLYTHTRRQYIWVCVCNTRAEKAALFDYE